MYIEKCLKELDFEVMEAFVIKEVETVEQHISLFNKISSLAIHENQSQAREVTGVLTENFLPAFCIHYKGNERFGHFLAAWYKEVATSACDTLSIQNTRTLWSYLVSEYNDEISSLDRSALVSAVAVDSYTFYQLYSLHFKSCFRITSGAFLQSPHRRLSLP